MDINKIRKQIQGLNKTLEGFKDTLNELEGSMSKDERIMFEDLKKDIKNEVLDSKGSLINIQKLKRKWESKFDQ